MEIQVARIIPHTQTEGPGWRYCIWVQGCDIHCDGCANQEMWDFYGGFTMNTAEVISGITSAKDKIEGITFLGGEPFYQAKAISEIAAEAQASGLSVVVFTGREYGKLCTSTDENVRKVLRNTDLLIDGPFISERMDFSRPWVGSSNQNYWFLSSRYAALRNKLPATKNKLELRVQPDGQILLNGMANLRMVAEEMQWSFPNQSKAEGGNEHGKGS